MLIFNILVFLPIILGQNVQAARRLCRCSDLKRLYIESNCCGNEEIVLDTRIANCIFPHSQLPATCGSIKAAFNSPSQTCLRMNVPTTSMSTFQANFDVCSDV